MSIRASCWCIGLSAFATANLLGTQLTHDWAPGDFVPIVLLQSIGQAFTLLPIIIIALSNSDFTRATAFAAYIQIMRLGGAEIGVALMGPGCGSASRSIPTTSASMSRAAASMSPGCCSKLSAFLCQPRRRDRAGARAGDAVGAGAREANVLAYIDGFWLTFWIAMVALGSVA